MKNNKNSSADDTKKKPPTKQVPLPLVSGLNSVQLAQYCKFFDESGLEKLEVKNNNFTLKLKTKPADMFLSQQPVMAPASNFPVADQQAQESANITSAVVTTATSEENSGPVVVSPIMGTFYTKPNPTSNTFVKVGDNVVKGQVIGIVEAMKIMNEIESTEEGTVASILVQNGDAVVEGQKLLQLK